MLIIIFAITVVINALGAILIKIGASGISDIDFSWESIWNIMSSWQILLGIFLYAATFPAYSYILQKLNVSIAYPIFTSLSVAMVILISIIFLKESLTLMEVCGLVLLIGGIVLLTTGAAK